MNTNLDSFAVVIEQHASPSRAPQLLRPSKLAVLPRHPEGTRSGSLEFTGGETFLTLLVGS